MHFIKDIELGEKCRFNVFIYVKIDMYVHVYSGYIYYTVYIPCTAEINHA